MSDFELMVQFGRCKQWQDLAQWELLAEAYLNRGYVLNAGKCFENADECRKSVAVETQVQA